jgi:hypothetical protein
MTGTPDAMVKAPLTLKPAMHLADASLPLHPPVAAKLVKNSWQTTDPAPPQKRS